MNKFLQSLQPYFDTNARSFYLACLRIIVCIHLLKKLVLNWTSLDLLYGPESVISHIPVDFVFFTFDLELIRNIYPIIIMAYVFIILLYFFGIGKHLTAFVLFLFLAFFQKLNWLILNGGDNLLFFLMLYLVFADSYQYFSIKKLNFNNRYIGQYSNFLSNISALSILLHLCVVYFVSGISKAHADVWYNGVATYYTLSLERFSGTPFNSLLAKNGTFVTISTYFTLFLEIYFPVIVWIKKIRPYVLLLGMGLHLGIYFSMMLYDFQLIFIFIYGLFFTDEEYRSFYKKYLQKHVSSFSLKRKQLSKTLVANFKSIQS